VMICERVMGHLEDISPDVLRLRYFPLVNKDLQVKFLQDILAVIFVTYLLTNKPFKLGIELIPQGRG